MEDVIGNSGGDGSNGSPVTAVLVRDEEGEREVSVRGLFYAIGHTPNTKLFEVRDFCRGMVWCVLVGTVRCVSRFITIV